MPVVYANDNWGVWDSDARSVVAEAERGPAELGAERLLLAGTGTEMCVAQTAIDARESGLKVTVVPDACSSVDERNEQLALDHLERVVGVRLTREHTF